MRVDAIQATKIARGLAGRGTFTMEFDNYAEVPASMVEKLMEKEAK